MKTNGKIFCEQCKMIIKESEYENHIWDCFTPIYEEKSAKKFPKSDFPAKDSLKNFKEIKYIKCDICLLDIEEKNFNDHKYCHILDKQNNNLGTFKDIASNVIHDIFLNNDNGKKLTESFKKDTINNNLQIKTALNYYQRNNSNNIYDTLISSIGKRNSNQNVNLEKETNRIIQTSINEDVFLDNTSTNSNSKIQKHHNHNKSSREYDVFNITSRNHNKNNRNGQQFYSYEELLKLDVNNVKKSLNDKLIKELPCETMTKSTLCKLSKDDKKCTICYNEFEQNDRFIRLPCFHLFHESEIKEWFKANKTCPICKIDLEEVLK